MSGEDEVRDIHVVSEQLVTAVPEPIAEAAVDSDPEEYPEEEEEPEEDSEETPEDTLLDELMDRITELDDKVHELKELYQGEQQAAALLEALVHHLIIRNGDLADKLRASDQKVDRLEDEKEAIRTHLGHTINGLESRIQSLQTDKQIITTFWGDERRDRVRAEKLTGELEGEVRDKKVKIDKMKYVFKSAHRRFQHRVRHFPREERRSGRVISRELVKEIADEEHEDAIRRGL